jgi:4-hydroxy-tetrahydrodipicolinate reductase
VEAGRVAGIHQVAVATRGNTEIVRLDLKMYVGAKEPHDRVRLAGEPAMDILFEGGVAGESATIANLINAVPRLIALPPGIRTVLDLPAAADGRV